MLKFSDKSEPGSEATVLEKAILKHLEAQGGQIAMTPAGDLIMMAHPLMGQRTQANRLHRSNHHCNQ